PHPRLIELGRAARDAAVLVARESDEHANAAMLRREPAERVLPLTASPVGSPDVVRQPPVDRVLLEGRTARARVVDARDRVVRPRCADEARPGRGPIRPRSRRDLHEREAALRAPRADALDVRVRLWKLVPRV